MRITVELYVKATHPQCYVWVTVQWRLKRLQTYCVKNYLWYLSIGAQDAKPDRNKQAKWLRTTSEVYLDIVGQLRGHQVLEFVFAQGAGGSIFPSVCLELVNKGADGSFHDALCGDLESKMKRETKASTKIFHTRYKTNCTEKQCLCSHLLCWDAVRCVLCWYQEPCASTLTITSLNIYTLHLRSLMHTSAENT